MVIRPDAAAIREAGRRLGALADGAEAAADAYEQLRDPRWSGPAADAFGSGLAGLTGPLRATAQRLREAGGALVGHAAVVEEALAHLDRADALEGRWRARRAAEITESPLATPLAPPEPYDPTAGPGLAVATALRAQGLALLEQSAGLAAAVLLRVAADPPPAVSSFPVNLDVARTVAVLAADPAADPASLALATALDPLTAVPRDWQARVDTAVDAHGGEHLDLALDTAGAAPGIGAYADGLHLGLDLLRGRYESATATGLSLVPLAGDGINVARAAGRFGELVLETRRVLTPPVKAYERAADVVGRIEQLDAVVADLLPTEPDGTPSVGRVQAEVLAGAAGDERARPPSRTLEWALLASPGTRWRGAPGSYDPHPLLGPAVATPPTRWEGEVEVAEGDALVTYAVTATNAGALVGAPRALRRRALPPDVARRPRAVRFGEGEPEAVSAARAPRGPRP